jgi:glycosyltransferase A (GT-A) superfamily protein (DUF2064 family)
MSAERPRPWGNGNGRLGKIARRIAADVGDDSADRLLMAEMLKDAADLADSARNQQDRASYIAASMRMLQLMKALGIGGSAAHDSDGDDGGSPEARLADLMGSGPVVGDPEEA